MSSQSPRDPRDLPPDPVLRGATGCVATAGVVILTVTGVLAVLIVIGAFLLYLTCGGH